MAAVDRVRLSATLDVGGTVYTLRFDFDALAEGSEITGCDLLSRHPANVASSLSAAQLRGLLRACIRPSITPTEAGHIIQRASPQRAFEAVCRAWLLSMPERQPDDRKQAPRLTEAQVWQQCWSATRVRLGLSDEEFGTLTPRQLRLLLDTEGERREEQKLLFGLVAAMVANFSAYPPEHPLKPLDFFGGERDRRRKSSPSTAQTDSTRALLMKHVTCRKTSDGKEIPTDKDSTRGGAEAGSPAGN